MMRAFLAQVPAGVYRAADFLDNDGVSETPVKIAVSITVHANRRRTSRPGPARRAGGVFAKRLVTVDFSGSDRQVEGSVNAVKAITYSACFYVFRCLLQEDVPATAGLMRPIEVVAPAGTVVNARPPAAVGAGKGRLTTPLSRVIPRARHR